MYYSGSDNSVYTYNSVTSNSSGYWSIDLAARTASSISAGATALTAGGNLAEGYVGLQIIVGTLRHRCRNLRIVGNIAGVTLNLPQERTTRMRPYDMHVGIFFRRSRHQHPRNSSRRVVAELHQPRRKILDVAARRHPWMHLHRHFAPVQLGEEGRVHGIAHPLLIEAGKQGHIINIGSSGSEDIVAPEPSWETYRVNKVALKHHSQQWTRAFKTNQVPFKTSLITVDRLDTPLSRSRPTWTGNGVALNDVVNMIELCLNTAPNTCVDEIKAWVNLDHKQ